MIAMLLAAQLTAVPADGTRTVIIDPPSRGDLIHRRPAASTCFGGAGRLEASFGTPAALYRKGDRPAVGLRKWADYPNGTFCRVEASR
jgi:hypothetical protein